MRRSSVNNPSADPDSPHLGVQRNGNEPEGFEANAFSRKRRVSSISVCLPGRVHVSNGDTTNNGSSGSLSKPNEEESTLEVQVADKLKVPDGGWGWFVCLAGFLCVTTIDGVGSVFGLLLGPLCTELDASVSAVSFIGSSYAMLYNGCGVFVSLLINRYDCRRVCMVGSLLSAVAFAGAAFSPNFTSLLATYGIMAGVGSSLSYVPALVAYSQYFDRRKGMASGIVASGAGMGAILFGLCIDPVRDKAGFSGVCFMFCGMCCVCFLSSFLMRPLALYVQIQEQGPPQDKGRSDGESSSEVATSSAAKDGLEVSSSNPDHPIPTGYLALEPLPVMAVGRRRESISPLFQKDIFLPYKDKTQVGGGFPGMLGDLLENSSSLKGEVELCDPDKVAGSRGAVSDAFNGQLTQGGPRRMSMSITVTASSAKITPIFNVDENSTTDSHFAQHKEPTAGVFGDVASLVAMEEMGATANFLHLSGILYLKDMKVIVLIISTFFNTMVAFALLQYSANLALERGISSGDVGQIMSSYGVGGIISRLVINSVLDLPFVSSGLVVAMGNLASALVVIATIFSYNFVSFLVLQITFAISVSAFYSTVATVIRDVFGLDALTSIIGLVGLSRGVAAGLGPPLVGVVLDLTQSQEVTFIVMASFCIISTILSLLFYFLHRKEAKGCDQHKV